MRNGSLQGEHIFNALGDLAGDMAQFLTGSINAATPAHDAKRVEAANAIRQLQNQATVLTNERNQPDFRTGPKGKGDNANAIRYSQFCQATRSSIRNFVSRNPSLHTQGYTDLNRLLDDLDRFIIDRTAHDAARSELNKNRQAQFDSWFNRTRELMHSTFKLLRDAALVVNRTHIS